MVTPVDLSLISVLRECHIKTNRLNATVISISRFFSFKSPKFYAVFLSGPHCFLSRLSNCIATKVLPATIVEMCEASVGTNVD